MPDSVPAPSSHPLVFLLFLGLFAASGAAALIYEVVWFHLLRLTIGSSTFSLGILLACFMGGLCLGGLCYHRAVSVRPHPLKVYALIELCIGLCGILVPLALPLMTRLYIAFAGYSASALLVRSLVCGVLLLPPTILMGATLPAVSRWMQLTSTGFSRLGLCYTANLVGAVIGTALAGFYLLREFDVYVASGVAVAINAAIALACSWLASRTPYTGEASAADQDRLRPPQSAAYAVYIAIALSGFTALGAQVIWTRMLSLLLGTTVYTFSVILSVFLMGLGAGSALGSYSSRAARHPARLLVVLQILLVPAIAYAAYAITSVIPGLHFVTSTDRWWLRSLDDLLRVAVALVPATLCWGASFPLAVSATGYTTRDPGRLVGHIYAANTVGAILGSLGFSIVIIALIGTRQSHVVLAVCAGLAAAVILAALRAPVPVSISSKAHLRALAGRLLAGLVVLVLSFAVGNAAPGAHPGMIAFGRQVQRWTEPAAYLHISEGRHASIAVSKTRGEGYRSFHINGKTEASTFPEDMRLQRMLGHLPTILHPDPRSVLVMGFGAGITAGVFTRYPSIERIVIVELEPAVTNASGVYFREENYDVLNDPRTKIIYDDARHYITTTKETFDVITTDPIHPWTKGAAVLYTREFFQLSRAHLNPGGFLSQWVPLYETSPAAVKSQIGTFLNVFPNGSVWNSEVALKGYDVTLLGHTEPMVIDTRKLQQRLDRNQAARQSLADVGITSATELLRAYAGRREDLAQWLTDYQPNLDRNLRLEYLAGQALDRYDEERIYNRMTAQLRYPDDFLRLDPDSELALRRVFSDRYGTPGQ